MNAVVKFMVERVVDIHRLKWDSLECSSEEVASLREQFLKGLPIASPYVTEDLRIVRNSASFVALLSLKISPINVVVGP